MADLDEKQEKKRLKEEKKKFKEEQKAQKKEAKQRARELDDQEAELYGDDGSGFPIFVTTVGIVLVWLLILVVLIKLDVGGFGSKVLTPILKDVPVANKILPNANPVGTGEDEQVDEYGGYTSLKEAVEQIKVLELQLEQIQTKNETDTESVQAMRDEIARLKTFEASQLEFERIKTEFYEEVIYSDKGPGAEEYKKYYESIDPATAEMLYKQVVVQLEEDEEIKKYAQAYSEMKPKQAAGIFEAMTDNLKLAARILGQMEPDDRGAILGVMDADIAARLTKIMEPDS